MAKYLILLLLSTISFAQVIPSNVKVVDAKDIRALAANSKYTVLNTFAI